VCKWQRYSPSPLAYRYELTLEKGLDAFFLVRQDGKSPHFVLHIADASLVIRLPSGDTSQDQLLKLATAGVIKVLQEKLLGIKTAQVRLSEEKYALQRSLDAVLSRTEESDKDE